MTLRLLCLPHQPSLPRKLSLLADRQSMLEHFNYASLSYSLPGPFLWVPSGFLWASQIFLTVNPQEYRNQMKYTNDVQELEITLQLLALTAWLLTTTHLSYLATIITIEFDNFKASHCIKHAFSYDTFT